MRDERWIQEMAHEGHRVFGLWNPTLDEWKPFLHSWRTNASLNNQIVGFIFIGVGVVILLAANSLAWGLPFMILGVLMAVLPLDLWVGKYVAAKNPAAFVVGVQNKHVPESLRYFHRTLLDWNVIAQRSSYWGRRSALTKKGLPSTVKAIDFIVVEDYMLSSKGHSNKDKDPWISVKYRFDKVLREYANLRDDITNAIISPWLMVQELPSAPLVEGKIESARNHTPKVGVPYDRHDPFMHEVHELEVAWASLQDEAKGIWDTHFNEREQDMLVRALFRMQSAAQMELSLELRLKYYTNAMGFLEGLIEIPQSAKDSLVTFGGASIFDPDTEDLKPKKIHHWS